MEFINIKPNMISEESELKEIVIANTGTFKGYSDGEFELTPEIFQNVVMNFNKEKQALPLYRGHADLNVSVTGEEPPACGWILSLSADEQNLYALVEFTNEMQSSIEQGEYKYCSIYMKGNDVDRTTGEDIGQRLVSLAITNQPFLPEVPAIKLSQFSKTNNTYIGTEFSIMKSQSNKSKQTKQKIKLSASPLTETFAEAVQAEEQMDKMQEGKVVTATEKADEEKTAMEEVSAAMEDGSLMTEEEHMAISSMLEEAKNAIDPNMSLEDFVKMLLEQVASMKPSEDKAEEEAEEVEIIEETALAETEEVAKEEKAAEEVEKVEDETAITASSLAATILSNNSKNLTLTLKQTVKALNLSLSAKNKEIENLKKELQQEKSLILSAVVEDAISKGKILDNEKQIFLKLGQVDRNLFEEMLKTRNHQPSIVLGRLSNPEQVTSNKVANSKELNLSERERKMLVGAKVNIKA